MSADRVPPVAVLRSARALVEMGRHPESRVSIEQRLETAERTVLVLGSTCADPRTLPKLLVELSTLAGRLATALEEAGGERAVQAALGGRPVFLDRPGRRPL